MIVRIATEGQYLLPNGQRASLDELDDAIVAAVDARDTVGFNERFAALLEFVRAGERLDDAHLAPSDLILPPADTTLEEAAGEFTGDGMIPG